MKSGGGGSVGTELNFTVVGGTTQPENPKENTIWVNTEAEITSYHFGNAEPTAEEGMVWILSDWTGGTKFNALKKNSLTVYPYIVNQYINNTWELKSSLIYQNGSWSEFWNGYIYYQGDVMTSFTGGWEHKDGNGGGISYESDRLEISASGNSGESSTYGTKNKINFTEVKTIEITWMSSNGNRSRFMLRDDNNKAVAEVYTTSSQQGSKHTSYLDVSDITGEYYVCAGVWFAESTWVLNTIYSIKLEF